MDIEKWKLVSKSYGLHVKRKLVTVMNRAKYIYDWLSLISRSPGTSVGVSSILIGLILVGRAAFVFQLSFLSNLTKKTPYKKIEIKQQVINLSFGLRVFDVLELVGIKTSLIYRLFFRLPFGGQVL